MLDDDGGGQGLAAEIESHGRNGSSCRRVGYLQRSRTKGPGDIEFHFIATVALSLLSARLRVES